jgi:hypothetical protein
MGLQLKERTQIDLDVKSRDGKKRWHQKPIRF